MLKDVGISAIALAKIHCNTIHHLFMIVQDFKQLALKFIHTLLGGTSHKLCSDITMGSEASCRLEKISTYRHPPMASSIRLINVIFVTKSVVMAPLITCEKALEFVQMLLLQCFTQVQRISHELIVQLQYSKYACLVLEFCPNTRISSHLWVEVRVR